MLESEQFQTLTIGMVFPRFFKKKINRENCVDLFVSKNVLRLSNFQRNVIIKNFPLRSINQPWRHPPVFMHKRFPHYLLKHPTTTLSQTFAETPLPLTICLWLDSSCGQNSTASLRIHHKRSLLLNFLHWWLPISDEITRNHFNAPRTEFN